MTVTYSLIISKMARQIEDLKTPDLLAEVAPLPAKRGRKPLNGKPMTAAERKARSRARRFSATFDFSFLERCLLVEALTCLDRITPEAKKNDKILALKNRIADK